MIKFFKYLKFYNFIVSFSFMLARLAYVKLNKFYYSRAYQNLVSLINRFYLKYIFNNEVNNISSVKSKPTFINLYDFNSKFLDTLILTLILAISFISQPASCAPISNFTNKASLTKPVYKLGISETMPIKVVAEWPVTENTAVGEHFTARVIEDVVSTNGEILIPRSSHVKGTVVNLERARMFRRQAKVEIKFTEIIMPDNVSKLKIQADGSLIKDKNFMWKEAGKLVLEVGKGAALGAYAGFRIGGLMGAASDGSPLMIGAGVGASAALISFITAKGQALNIQPGLNMTLSLYHMEDNALKAQAMSERPSLVQAEILDQDDGKLTVKIASELNTKLSLNNLKVIDSLGYTSKVLQDHDFFKDHYVQAHSSRQLELDLPTQHFSKAAQWLVLTNSFNTEEYFRIAI
jgi:hypothetical protein